MTNTRSKVHVAEVPQPMINNLVIPDQLEVTGGHGIGTLGASMGILMVQLTAEHSVAVMPVAGNEQPFGLLHGGASCVLGELLGSLAANVHAMQFGKIAVGVDINATHTRSLTSGWVTGHCRAIHLGGSITVHEIVVEDAQGQRCSTVRITNMLRRANS